MKNTDTKPDLQSGKRNFGSFLILLCLLIASPGLKAQSLEMISSQPEHMSSEVPLSTTISFTFNVPLDLTQMGPLQHHFFARPEGKITIENADISQDGSTVNLQVAHEADTDYAWFFLGLVGEGGEIQHQFQLLNYTTGSSVSDHAIEGSLSYVNVPLLFDKSSLNDISALMARLEGRQEQQNGALREKVRPDYGFGSPSTSARENLSGMNFRTFSGTWKHPENGPVNGDDSMYQHMKSVQTENEFEIPWGTSVIWLLENLDFMYDDESDGPGDELVNIGVTDGETGEYIIENVRPGEYYVAAVLMRPGGSYRFVALGFYEDEYGDPVKISVSNESLTGIDITLYGFFKELSEPIEASEAYSLARDFVSNEDPAARPVHIWGEDSGLFQDFYYKLVQEQPSFEPTGLSYFWEVVLLNDTDEILHFVLVIGDMVAHYGVFELSDIPEHELPPIPLTELKTIPENFISSQVALQTALNNNLEDLLVVTQFEGWYELEHSLGGFFFMYPDLLDETAPVFWDVLFDADVWDYEQDKMVWVESNFLIDALTGDFLGKRVYTDDQEFLVVDFMEIFPIVAQEMGDITKEAILIQAFGREDLNLPQPPTGMSQTWMVVWFEPADEIVHMFFTRGYDIEGYDSFPLSDVPEEQRPPVDQIRPVDVRFGSEHALNTAMGAGLGDQLYDSPPDVTGRINYHLSNFYYHFPDILDQDSNAFWQVEASVEAYNDDWVRIYHKLYSHLVDAVTGEHLGSIVQTTTEESRQLPSEVALHQNYPNPFNPVTIIGFTLPANTHVRLEVFNILGERVAILLDENREAGTHQVDFNASRLSSGVYVYRLTAGDRAMSRKMILTK